MYYREATRQYLKDRKEWLSRTGKEEQRNFKKNIVNLAH